jgi:hypothetical protein
MNATLAYMPRKKKSPETPASKTESNTEPVRVAADLARKIRVIALAYERPGSEILSEQLRPFIDSEYPKALKKLLEREQQGG